MTTVEGLAKSIREDAVARAKAKGAEALDALQKADFHATADQIARALSGDERAKVALQAEFSLTKFSVEARAWLELRAWRDALIDTLLAIAATAVTEGIKLAARSLAGSLQS